MKNKHVKNNKQKQKINQKQFESALKGFNPLKLNIFLSCFWIVTLFVMSVVFIFVNERSYVDNLSAASVISFCIATIWILLRIGIAERLMLFFRNRRIKQIGRIHHKHVKDTKIEEYREIRQKKPWIGIWIYFGFSLFMVILTLLLVFLI